MKPLADLRIVAVEQYGAGPFGSVHLADLGADVIKIEDPATGGDVGRYVPPFQEEEDSLFYETFNRNKRSLSLNLSTPSGREVFEDLVRVSDAVYANLRGDVPAKLKIRYEDLAPINPRIVCVNISGFGMASPRAAQPGYDYIVQGLAGWMSLTGEPGGPPVKTGLSVVDYCGGFVGALSLLAAVHRARRDGVGGDCDVSLHDVALTMLTYPAAWHLNGGWAPERIGRSAHPSLVPFQLFQGQDGEWFVLACPKEKFWVRTTDVIGQPDLATDSRFNNFAARRSHREELIALLDRAFASRPAQEWIALLEAAGVPTGPVLDVAEALREPVVESRGLVVETEHERFGTISQMRSPVRVGDESDMTYRRAPARNEDAADILRDLLGYNSDRVTALDAAGAFDADAGGQS